MDHDMPGIARYVGISGELLLMGGGAGAQKSRPRWANGLEKG